jgi:hypothetical protein
MSVVLTMPGGESMALGTLLQVVQAETILCSEMAGLMEALLGALLQREGERVQALLGRFQELSASLAQAEAVRTRLYLDLAEYSSMAPALGMAALIERQDPGQRPAFALALREFKATIARMHSLSQHLSTYTNSQLLTLENFFVELLPERHAGTYGANGSKQASSRPVLVNSFG